MPAVERIDDGSEADERVLGHLARLGCDATTPCISTHFLYLPAREGADATATTLSSDGWATAIEAGDDDETWLVTATRHGALNSRSVRSTRTQLEALAAEHAGVYDGWQATVL